MVRSTYRYGIVLFSLLLALLCAQPTAAAPNLSGTWKLLYQNDADWARASSDSARQPGYMLYAGTIANRDVAATCSAIGETPYSTGMTVEAGLQKQLSYLLYDGSYPNGRSFWVRNIAGGSSSCTAVYLSSSSVTVTTRPCTDNLPVLCTQSARRSSSASTSSASANDASKSINVKGLTAYRDAFSFRFIQLPYANKPTRFADSTVYTGGAAGADSSCLQSGSGGEDCLTANVFTPVISAANNPLALKPIMLWVYGGGFNSGSGSDATFDGGSLASRGDVVVVTPNYRIGTLGFLSVNSQASGNWAVGDLITALKWVKANAATFGGDPNKITIFGQSAGAQLVMTLLASKAASGLFQNAIIQSGRPSDKANYRITAAAAQAGPAADTIRSLGCGNSFDVLGCLRGLPASKFTSSTVFNKIVVDGRLVTEPNIDVAQLRRGFVNKVPVLMGFMRDEAGSLGYAPPTSQTDKNAALRSGGISDGNITIINNNPSLFPTPGGSNGIQQLTVTVETDITSINRCGQQATLNSAASTGVFSSLYAYTQDQRAYQIRGYDPYGVCSSSGSATSGYLCHSGDLYPTFNTAGYAGSYSPRDGDDIIHSALMMDYWSSFARSGNPNPPPAYMAVRGYNAAANRMTGNTWPAVTNGNIRILSLGPSPVVKGVARNPQCNAFNLGLDYISQGR